MSFDLSQIALSTCWASEAHTDAEAILDALQETGLTRLELDYRIRQRSWPALRAGLKARGFVPVSVHNYFPHPAHLPPELASGDLYNPASDDADERALALEGLLASCQEAAELEATRVVVRLGRAPGAWDRGLMRAAADDPALLPPELERRAAGAARALDRVSFMLEKVLRTIEPWGVRLGLENRFHFYELPSLEECSLLLERFAGGPLGHWHDLGHSAAQSLVGLPGPQEWLERFGDVLEGCHLHDYKGMDDHQPPGQGEADWDWVGRAFKDAPLIVMEVHPGPDAAEISEAAGFLAGRISAARAGTDQDQASR